MKDLEEPEDPPEEPEDPPDDEDLEELRALGLVLAGTVITLPGFNTITDSGNCLDDASLMPLRGRCTKADIVSLRECLVDCLTRRPHLPNRWPPKDKSKPSLIKSQEEIK